MYPYFLNSSTEFRLPHLQSTHPAFRRKHLQMLALRCNVSKCYFLPKGKPYEAYRKAFTVKEHH